MGTSRYFTWINQRHIARLQATLSLRCCKHAVAKQSTFVCVGYSFMIWHLCLWKSFFDTFQISHHIPRVNLWTPTTTIWATFHIVTIVWHDIRVGIRSNHSNRTWWLEWQDSFVVLEQDNSLTCLFVSSLVSFLIIGRHGNISTHWLVKQTQSEARQ